MTRDHSLKREQVATHVRSATASLPHADCRTCDCLQGFLTQLRLDAGDDVEDILAPWLVERADVHG